MKKNTLIYGGGAIGSFLAVCLINSNHKVFFLCRKENYKNIKKNGLVVKVFNNKILLNKYHLINNKNFIISNSIDKFKTQKFDNIFITTKITENLKRIFYKIEPYVYEKTLIITPCTSIPFWWYSCLKKNSIPKEKIKKNLDKIFVKNLKRKNLVGMTMWLSGKLKSPGNTDIKHIQRGFPIKEVFHEKNKSVNELRKDISKTCISPIPKNIFSEIFIKSINSLAFNLIALKYNQNNFKLSKNKKAKLEILKILKEGDKILTDNNIRIYQSAQSRINQTLKSTKHTMSMLNAFKKKKKIELNQLWHSFDNLLKNINSTMIFTKKTFFEVKKKLNERI